MSERKCSICGDAKPLVASYQESIVWDESEKRSGFVGTRLCHECATAVDARILGTKKPVDHSGCLRGAELNRQRILLEEATRLTEGVRPYENTNQCSKCGRLSAWCQCVCPTCPWPPDWCVCCEKSEADARCLKCGLFSDWCKCGDGEADHDPRLTALEHG